MRGRKERYSKGQSQTQNEGQNLIEVRLTFEFEFPGSQSNEGNNLQKTKT